MSDDNNIIASTSKNLTTKLIDNIRTNQSYYYTASESQNKISNLPSVVDYDTLNKIKSGEYGISLKDYTTLSAYNNTMLAFYGNSSANKFSNYLNKFLGDSTNNKQVSAKTFLEKMKENGISNKSALKMYSAFQKYNTTEIINSSFVSATI